LAIPEPLAIEQVWEGFIGDEAIAIAYAAPGVSDPKVRVPFPPTVIAAPLLTLTVRPDPVSPVTFPEIEYEVGALVPPPPPPPQDARNTVTALSQIIRTEHPFNNDTLGFSLVRTLSAQLVKGIIHLV
jgi:hypothetical protein